MREVVAIVNLFIDIVFFSFTQLCVRTAVEHTTNLGRMPVPGLERR